MKTKMTRRQLERLSWWFETGLRDVVEGNLRPVPPSAPDIQCDPGPRPHTDWAYEQGRALGAMILTGEEVGAEAMAMTRKLIRNVAALADDQPEFLSPYIDRSEIAAAEAEQLAPAESNDKPVTREFMKSLESWAEEAGVPKCYDNGTLDIVIKATIGELRALLGEWGRKA